MNPNLQITERLGDPSIRFNDWSRRLLSQAIAMAPLEETPQLYRYTLEDGSTVVEVFQCATQADEEAVYLRLAREPTPNSTEDIPESRWPIESIPVPRRNGRAQTPLATVK